MANTIPIKQIAMTQENYDTMIANGSVVIDEVTYNYDPTIQYITDGIPYTPKEVVDPELDSDAVNKKYVDNKLSTCIKDTDIATPTKPGICKIGAGGNGIRLVDNMATIMLAAKLHLDNRGNQYSVINSGRYDYAVKKALTDNEHAPHSGDYAATWTEDDKSNARQLLNAEVAITTSTIAPSTLMNNTRCDLTNSDPVVTITLTPDAEFTRGDIMFTTGTTINLITSNIKFKGRDCNQNGIFDIQPNTNYYINFIKFGNQVIGFVATL